MSADLLRRAAALMRQDWSIGDLCPDRCGCNSEDYHPSAEFHQAAADWLDNEAEHIDASVRIWAESSQDPINQWAERGMTVESNVEHHWHDALKTARAYLGEQS